MIEGRVASKLGSCSWGDGRDGVASKLGSYNVGDGGRKGLSEDDMAVPAGLAADPDRATLARWLLGRWDAATDGTLDEAALDRLLDLAWGEGVQVQACATLAAVDGLAAQRRQDCQDWVRGQAAAALGLQARLRAVLQCLHQAGIPALVLKGAALAQWLYPAPYLRESSDVDLLFANRDDALRAATALEGLGYARPHPPERFRHELACRGSGDLLDLDLHWALSDWPVLDRLPDFDTLFAASIPLPGLGTGARGLDAPHALLHACVHRASNLAADLGDRLKWLYDLHLLAAVLDRDAGWPTFLAACEQAQACGIAAEGLAAATDLFGTPVPPAVSAALTAARTHEPLDASRLSDWRYIQKLNFRALPDWGTRLAWIGGRLLPPAGHLRALYGEDLSYPALLWQRLRKAGSRLRRG